jgi:hypothetical protein
LISDGLAGKFIVSNNIATMPYNASDMTATLVSGSLFGDNKNSRIYLAGGCISDQHCDLNPGWLQCHCPSLTNKVIYFDPEEEKYTSLASMPRPRFRHMSELFVSN